MHIQDGVQDRGNERLAQIAYSIDRVFDNYVMNVMQVVVSDALRPEASRDPYGVERACADLDRIYVWLDKMLEATEWAAGGGFTLADCAAAPALFYPDWVHPIDDRHATLKAYRARLLARPSVARCVKGARPYRAYFPLGAPDRGRSEPTAHLMRGEIIRNGCPSPMGVTNIVPHATPCSTPR